MRLPTHPWHQPAATSVDIIRSCKYSQMLLMMGEDIARNIQSWLIHSFSSLSYDRSIVSSKASSPHSAILSFLLQIRISSPSSSFLRLLPFLPVTSVPPFIFPSIACCRRQFLRKMWPIQLAFRLLISCRIFLWELTRSK